MKKIVTILFALFIILPQIVFATNIDLSVDKTSLSTDDVAHISISINGSVDGGQVGLVGLENFKIIEKQSSQSVQVINGQASQMQKKDLVIQPKKAGKFSIKALAKNNGNEISSNEIIINVQQSAIDKTKDKLLKDNNDNQDNSSKNNKLDDIIKNQKPESDFDTNLLKESQNSESESKANTQGQNNKDELKVNKITDFPKVEHISQFNAVFWLEFIGSLLLVLLLILGVIFVSKKYRK